MNGEADNSRFVNLYVYLHLAFKELINGIECMYMSHCVYHHYQTGYTTYMYNHLEHACANVLGCVTGYQVIRVIRIFAKTYPFE